jgi:ubiquinone/menaquinone biosynthesis C-methylase UbiE
LSQQENTSAVPERLIPGTLAWELFYVEHRQRYEWAAAYCKNKLVLDVACGTGYGSEILARKGASKVVGLDIAYSFLNSNGEHNALLAGGDVCKLPFSDNTFEIVVSFETIEHIDNPEGLLAEIARVLRPEGLCICSSPNRDFLPFTGEKEVNPFHISEMSYEEFTDLFSKYFDVSERFSQTHTAGYIRHLELLRELDERLKPIRFSRMMRWEKKIRALLGNNSLNGLEALPTQLGRAVPGDYIIEPLEKVTSNLLTIILIGQKA